MSMLSAQIDELRQVAQVYRNLGKYATEQMLLDAADTILELRDDLQRANSSLQDAEHDESVAWDRVRKAERENARLRELVKEMYEDQCCDSDQWKYLDRIREMGGGLMGSLSEEVRTEVLCGHICDLEAENDRLREIAAGIGHLLFPLDVDYCAACPRDDINHPCPVHTVKGGECLYKTDLRDLGIEVPQ